MRLMTAMLIGAMLLALGCGENGPAPLTKDEARALAAGGKADGVDLCADTGWYGDGECDTFCGQPDPDCTCAAAGGECVGVYPGACANGTIAEYSCGGGVGVMCCLPGPEPAPEPTACAAAGGECVGVYPGACANGTIGEESCGGGVGVMCCLPAPAPTACAAAGGECVAVYPGTCAGGTIGDANDYSCGGGVGVMCCLSSQ